MMAKIKVPTKEQAQIIKRSGIEHPFLWVVVQDLTNCMIVKNTLTCEFKVIDK